MAFTLGSIVGGIGKVLGGVIKGTPIGGAINAIEGVGQILSKPAVGKVLNAGPQIPLPRGLPNPYPVLQGGGLTGGGVIPSGGAPPSLPAMAGGVPQPGTSIVKTDVRGAVPSQYGTTAHAGQMGHYTRTGRFIRTTAKGKAIRRMNPMNVHAARRAVRRIKAGDKLFRKIFRILHHHRPQTAVKRGKR